MEADCVVAPDGDLRLVCVIHVAWPLLLLAVKVTEWVQAFASAFPCNGGEDEPEVASAYSANATTVALRLEWVQAQVAWAREGVEHNSQT
jgi:hypothetical protein